MSTIHNSSIDLNLLTVFHRIYLDRSVSEAARRLGLTQSAISHALRKLRAIFNDELFVRTGSAMEPTARARQLAEPVQDMINSLESRILPAVAFDPMKARREFSLAMGDMAEVVFLPPLLRFLAVHAPSCSIRTNRVPNESIVQALEGGRTEMVIGNVAGLPAHIYRQTLFHHGYVVLCAADHPRLKKRRLVWDDYRREAHLVVASGLDKNLEDHTLIPRGIQRRVQLSVGGFLSVPWLIEGTELIATVPGYLGERIARGAQVTEHPLPDPVAPYAIQSIWHPHWHNDPGHRWLREKIFEVMHRYPDVRA